MPTLFIVCNAPPPEQSGADLSGLLRTWLKGFSGVHSALLMLSDRTPADQPFAADGEGPPLVIQIDFSGPVAADAANRVLGGLPQLLDVPGQALTLQFMEAHAFPFAAPALEEPYCTFFVTYRGTTDDLPGWLAHYDAHHPPIMKTFPDIREVWTYWPLEGAEALMFARGTAMQRNKVVFQSLNDLIGALASPVMVEMRADGQKFPPMTERATHFPMATWRLA